MQNERSLLKTYADVLSLQYVDAFTDCLSCTEQNESPDSLFIDGKTLYPKKQFHSSPSWVCLHLSGTTPPQYLTGQIMTNLSNRMILSESTAQHLDISWLPYLMPLLMVSVGAQLAVSTQSVQWYCLLSRNQPESDKPRTCIPVCPRLPSISATRSTLRRTPVPPALHTHIGHMILTTILNNEWNVGDFKCEIISVISVHAHTCFLLTAELWRCPDLCSADP